MNAMVPRAGVPWLPFALIPEPAWLVAAALGRMTVLGTGDKQLMLELEFYLAEVGLASLTCLQQGTAAMRAGWASLSPCTQGRMRAFVGSSATVSPLPVLPAAFTAWEEVPDPRLEDTTGLMLSCSWQQVLSGAKAQPLGQMLFKAGWTDRQQEPKARLTPCITAQNLAGW